MTSIRRTTAPCLLTATALLALALAGSTAHAQSNARPSQPTAPSPRGIAGKWSALQTCDAQAAQIVFRGNTMELWDAGRRLFSGGVRFRSAGSETAVTITSIARSTPQLPGNPEVGDVSSFRRDGNRMYPVAITRNGQRLDAPTNVPPFYLCP